MRKSLSRNEHPLIGRGIEMVLIFSPFLRPRPYVLSPWIRNRMTGGGSDCRHSLIKRIYTHGDGVESDGRMRHPVQLASHPEKRVREGAAGPTDARREKCSKFRAAISHKVVK